MRAKAFFKSTRKQKTHRDLYGRQSTTKIDMLRVGKNSGHTHNKQNYQENKIRTPDVDGNN